MRLSGIMEKHLRLQSIKMKEKEFRANEKQNATDFTDFTDIKNKKNPWNSWNSWRFYQ
jgi:hypothetical protein